MNLNLIASKVEKVPVTTARYITRARNTDHTVIPLAVAGLAGPDARITELNPTLAPAPAKYVAMVGLVLIAQNRCVLLHANMVAAICTAPCQNGGSCVAPDTCTCPPTHVGPVCETRRIVAAVTDFIDQYNVSDVVAGHLERLLSISDTNHGNESLLHCVDDSTCTAIGHKICVPPMIELGQQHCRSFCKFCISNFLAEPDACMSNAADVVFVVDASSSVGLSNFDKVKTFLKNTVSHFNIDQKHTRVALIEFSSQVTLMFHLNDFTDITNLMSGIDNMTYSGERPMIPDVAVIITDGLSKYPTLTRRQADHAKDEGITMFVVGVGNETDHQEVRYMASDDNDLFQVDDYDDLEGIHLDVAKVVLPSNHHSRNLSTPSPISHECVDMLPNCTSTPATLARTMKPTPGTTVPKRADITEPACADTLDNCDAFGAVMCLRPKYLDWVNDYCRKTCGVCGSKKDLWTTAPATTPTTEHIAAPVRCKDEVQNCQNYDADLCTNPAYSNFRQVSCRKYCGLCYVKRQIPSITVPILESTRGVYVGRTPNQVLPDPEMSPGLPSWSPQAVTFEREHNIEMLID
ncbi:COCA1-like protein [Mya arenaria]|uniref:COCA1-like protein n=1 Tax=Mya arenaria TaxID=6604 RepID=A0ABY7D8S6_MYAAR|nr:COCA1-like protein [Mya arenaria]